MKMHTFKPINTEYIYAHLLGGLQKMLSLSFGRDDLKIRNGPWRGEQLYTCAAQYNYLI